MAHQESLIQWASSNRHRIALSAKEFDGIWKLGFPVFDFEVSMTIDGFRGVGRGSDLVETTALTKALAEAVERILCASLSISTLGVAAHSDRVLARQNAQAEALERYAFDRHLKNREQFAPLDRLQTKFFLPKMRFFRMNLPVPHYATLCFLSEGSDKLLGLGCALDLSESMDHAALEVLRNFSALQADPVAFRQAIGADPNLWCCRPDFLTNVEALFGNTPREAAPGVLPSFVSEVLGTMHLPTLADCSLVFERSILAGEATI